MCGKFSRLFSSDYVDSIEALRPLCQKQWNRSELYNCLDCDVKYGLLDINLSACTVLAHWPTLYKVKFLNDFFKRGPCANHVKCIICAIYFFLMSAFNFSPGVLVNHRFLCKSASIFDKINHNSFLKINDWLKCGGDWRVNYAQLRKSKACLP